jgi:hypothetical protein
MGLHDLKAAQMGGKVSLFEEANKSNQLALRFIPFDKLSCEVLVSNSDKGQIYSFL